MQFSKKTTLAILVITAFLISLFAVSGQALAYKRGTILADRCSKTHLFAEIRGYTPSYVREGYLLKRDILYAGEGFATSINRGTIYLFTKFPRDLKKAKIIFQTNNKTYTSSYSAALKKGKGKYC